jgi:hypothetical protein
VQTDHGESAVGQENANIVGVIDRVPERHWDVTALLWRVHSPSQVLEVICLAVGNGAGFIRWQRCGKVGHVSSVSWIAYCKTPM